MSRRGEGRRREGIYRLVGWVVGWLGGWLTGISELYEGKLAKHRNGCRQTWTVVHMYRTRCPPYRMK